jgi:hypothetical protein
MNDKPFDLEKFRVHPEKWAAAPIPTKIRKRRDQFILVPLWWYEKLAKPVPVNRCTCLVAMYLLYLNWKNDGKPFKLANGMLRYDGVSRYAKRRALADLEKRKLITVERRPWKSPVIRVHA